MADVRELLDRSHADPSADGVTTCGTTALRWSQVNASAEINGPVFDNGGATYNVKHPDYGAVGDGVTNDSAAFSNWWSDLQSGGVGIIPPGTYMFSSQVTLDSWTAPVEIRAFGAVIKTSGAISGIKTGTKGTTTAPLTINGLKIDHRNNATATYGFDVVGSWLVRLVDCTVVADDVAGTYAAFRLAMSNAADSDTGPFWCEIIRPWVRMESGGDGTDIPYGILLEGNPNACAVRGGGLNNVTTGIRVQDQSGGDGRIANGLVVDGVAFEGYGTAVHVHSGTTSATISGHRFVNNRFEDGTTVFSYTGITSQPAVAPWFSGNHLISNAGTYLNNPNSLEMTLWDFSRTPDIGVPTLERGIKIRSLSGSDLPLDIHARGGNRGIHLRRLSDGTAVAQLVWTGSTAPSAALIGLAASEMSFRGVRGVGGDGTNNANNLRGSITFASSSSVNVSFGNDEADASYYVVVTGDVSETFSVTGKSTSGFTIGSSNTNSTGTVDWMLMR